MSGCVSPATAAASWRSEVRATLALGWPIILTNLAQMAIGITDTVMMGWLGPTQLAAGTLGANLYLGFYVVGVGLTLATAPLLAQSLGARRHAVRACRPVVRQGLWQPFSACRPGRCCGTAAPSWRRWGKIPCWPNRPAPMAAP